MELLKRLNAQYTVFISGFKIKNKVAVAHKVRVFELYENENYNYEAVFNIGYIDNKENVVVINGFGETEEEAINNLEINILKKKEKFLLKNVAEVFY